MPLPWQRWRDAAHKAVLGAICCGYWQRGGRGGPHQKQGMLHVAGQYVSAPHSPQSSHSLLSPFLPFAAALGLTEKLVSLNLSGKAKLVSMGKSLQEEMEALLGPDGVLLYPSHPTIAPKHHSPICMPFNFAYTGEQPWLLWGCR